MGEGGGVDSHCRCTAQQVHCSRLYSMCSFSLPCPKRRLPCRSCSHCRFRPVGAATGAAPSALCAAPVAATVVVATAAAAAAPFVTPTASSDDPLRRYRHRCHCSCLRSVGSKNTRSGRPAGTSGRPGRPTAAPTTELACPGESCLKRGHRRRCITVGSASTPLVQRG